MILRYSLTDKRGGGIIFLEYKLYRKIWSLILLWHKSVEDILWHAQVYNFIKANAVILW